MNNRTAIMQMKCLAATVLAMAAALLTFEASAQDSVVKDSLCFSPSEWVGKYPSESAGDTKHFLDLPCVRKSLLAMLSMSEYENLKSQLRVDSPIEMLGRFLIIAKCEAHDCPNHHAMIIIDTDSTEVIVGIYRRGMSSSRTTWYATGMDPLELPPEVQEQFLRRHNPK